MRREFSLATPLKQNWLFYLTNRQRIIQENAEAIGHWIAISDFQIYPLCKKLCTSYEAAKCLDLNVGTLMVRLDRELEEDESIILGTIPFSNLSTFQQVQWKAEQGSGRLDAGTIQNIIFSPASTDCILYDYESLLDDRYAAYYAISCLNCAIPVLIVFGLEICVMGFDAQLYADVNVLVPFCPRLFWELFRHGDLDLLFGECSLDSNGTTKLPLLLSSLNEIDVFKEWLYNVDYCETGEFEKIMETLAHFGVVYPHFTCKGIIGFSYLNKYIARQR